MTTTSDLVVNVNLHETQAIVFSALRDLSVRELTVRKGRRWGGTYVTATACTEFAINNPISPGLPGKPTEIAFFGPLYENAKKIFQELCDSFGPVLDSVNKSELSLVWRGGARGKCYSGENAAAALGSGFDIVVIDEASNFPEHLIRSIITPTLADRGGRLFLISSPRHGRLNWFAIRATAAESGSIPNVKGFHFRSSDNPHISRAWLDAQRADTDQLTWNEEYEALILESSSSWLDPSLIQYIDTAQIPGNTFNALIADFAWGDPEPGMVDATTRRRKDANVLAVISQDAMGAVYVRIGSVYEKFLEPSVAFAQSAKLIKDYNIMKFCVEREVTVSRKVEDLFGRLWNEYRGMHNLPTVGMVRPHRHAHWKTSAIRMWSRLLERRKFYVERGCELATPLIEEMTKYSEAAVAKDRCHDDVLVVMSDIMQPGIWMGRLENETMQEPVGGPDRYHLRDAWDAINNADDNARQPYISRYGPI